VSAPDATVLVGERPPQEGVEVLPVRIAGSVEGYLVVEGAVGRDELRRVAVEQAATVFALELAKIRSAEQAELQLRGDLLEELFGESLVDEGSVERRAARLGLDVREPHTVLVARTLEAEPGDGQSARVRRRLLQVAASLSRREAPGGIVAWKNDAVVLVAPGSSAEAALALGRRFAVEGRAAASQTVVVGIGGACSAPADYARSFQEAGRAADAGRRLPRLGTVVPYTSLDFHQLVLGTRPAEDLRRMAQTLLEPLLGGGSRAGSLLPTVRAYLAAGGNLEAASRALGIHVNTLRHRVNRISKLLGRDLASLRTRIDLHLAIEVLGDVSSDGQELRRGQQA
jgi:sugar diacid utilization regulator